MKSPTQNDIIDHYSSGYEDNRLTAGWGLLERERTYELLAQCLPAAPASIADIGGGSGVYSCWLADKGYAAHLLDLVPLHVELAAEYSKAQADNSLASLCVGDSRELPWTDNQFDASLVLGPLYHLTERKDRITTLKEALRVLKPHGTLMAAAITRFASAMDGLRRGLLDDPTFEAVVHTDIATGHHANPQNNPEYFMQTFFHHPDELKQEIMEAGFGSVELYAIEGPSWIVKDFTRWWKDENSRGQLLTLSRMLQSEPSLLGVSPHIMAVASA